MESPYCEDYFVCFVNQDNVSQCQATYEKARNYAGLGSH